MRKPVRGCSEEGPQNDHGVLSVKPPSAHGSTNSKSCGLVMDAPRGAARVGSLGRVHDTGDSSPCAPLRARTKPLSGEEVSLCWSWLASEEASEEAAL